MSNYAKSLDKLKSSASGAATVRAFAHLEADEKIRNPDNLAIHFLETPPGSTDALDAFKQQLDEILPGAYHFQNARTLHIDHCISRAIEAGCQQVVLLGAGYDSRAYRLVTPDQGVRFIEVDLPALQADKKQKVKDLLGVIPEHVSYCPIDFNNQLLEEVLEAAGYNSLIPTYFNWEGVSYYLTPEGVDATLHFVASHSAKGSKILFDYMPLSMIDHSVEYYGGNESHSYMSQMGEPVIFGIADGAIASFLQQRGLAVVSDVGPEQLAERYLTRSDGEIDGRVAGYIRMVEAQLM